MLYAVGIIINAVVKFSPINHFTLYCVCLVPTLYLYCSKQILFDVMCLLAVYGLLHGDLID